LLDLSRSARRERYHGFFKGNNKSKNMKKEIKNKEDIFKTINGVLVEYLGNEKNVIIPEYITEIGDNVFYENNDIISIFSKNIKKTGSDCFYSCSELTEISLPALQQTGSYCFRSCAALTEISLPALQQTGSDCFYSCSALTEISLPALQQTGRDCFRFCAALTEISLPELQQTGSYCFRSCSALTEISLPALQQTGSDCFSFCDALTEISLPALQQTGSDCFYSCAALTEISLPDKKILVEYLDNIVTYIIRKRKNVIIGGINLCVNDSELKYDECFIVTDGVNFSHGKSIKEAKKSLLYKISNRDTTKYKSMNLDSVLTLKEGIEAYRVITGACEFGVKNFIEGLGKAKSKYTIKEIIKITKGCYGNNTFSNFFNKNK